MTAVHDLLEAAKDSIREGDNSAAADYLKSAKRAFAKAAQAARLEAIKDRADTAEAEAGNFSRWRGLLAYAVGTGRGTSDYSQLLDLLTSAPAFDPLAPIRSKKRTDFYNWHTANRAEIRRLQTKIIDQL